MKAGDDAVGCAECHAEPGTAPKSKDKKLSDSEKLEYHAEALHANCITCHKAYNKENNTKDAPASCAKCHPKK
jgi:mono/diheme cytochrome c family protein